ncbi:MAG: 3-hydroxyacyl-CoA dehydrogenase/enoyl-CoA hydratase family protein, partial [Acidimicrobiia bacterium]|nr:3-hydroxyacyl-CoA dehydrogenase/enoyl-CoA hydratase family protein [Acidimicrobiia bacterium]
AAHLANAGIPSYLFDIAPGELTPEEEAAGLTLGDRKVRNRISQAGVAAMLKSKPALLFHKDLASLVTACNYEDDVEKLGECDWIVEVVVERMDVKQRVFEMVDTHRKAGSVITSNTSGLSAEVMAEGRSDDFRSHFMVTHFFNPVRYMRLLELVPISATDPAVYAAMAEFGERVLGKGIVHCKDTPNFIGNRIGTFGITSVFRWMREFGASIPEVDSVFGPATGRPKSAVFRTADIVGLDTMAHVIKTIAEQCPDDPWVERFQSPDFMKALVDDGRIGQKAGAGFYKKSKNDEGKTVILALDPDSGDYVDPGKVRLDSVGAARAAETAADKLKAMVWFDDDYGRLVWKVTAETAIYSAQLLGEIADDIVNVDNAMKWGYSFEMGPFESWDAIGVEESVARMRDEGMEIPEVVEHMLKASDGTWYVTRDGVRHFWDVTSEQYEPIETPPGVLFIGALRDTGGVIHESPGATLFDMGDGVGLVEFHTKMNALDPTIDEVINAGLDRVDAGDMIGLVIGNEATNFSVGANVGLVGMAAMGKDWDTIEQMVAGLQNTMMRMKYSSGPVVVAPRGMALGGGAEVVMHGSAVRAHAETYLGLVELGVGLIPAGGGVKELAFRYYGSIPTGVQADPLPYMQRIFEIIGTAQVATSAVEARDLGFLKDTDMVTLNPDRVLADAKADVIRMVEAGWKPALPVKVRVPGSGGIAALKVAVHGMRGGGYLSEYDQHLGGKLATVICGGDVPGGTMRTEQEFLDLEREAFLSLCGEEKTLARIMHMLEKGKPLRN